MMPLLHDCALSDTLSQGTDTIVRQATHKPSGESFVVKMSVPGSSSQRAIGRLIHEHRMLVKLADVPGVIRTRGVEYEGALAVLWLEDQKLRSLDRILSERGRMPLVTALRVGLDLSRVLQGIHAGGVVHKDVKPQNVLWDEANGRVTLFDFAIASELSEEATNAAIPEALEGTLAYMSPEQTGRTARGLDARTDIYSLGVVLFELLHGNRPFVETDPLALVHAHLAKPVPALEKLVPGLPPIVARLVERCLEKHPEKRYQTAMGLAADLAECVRQWETSGTIASFVLGRKDFSPALRIPQTLVSREEETGQIKAAFDRCAAGAVEVLLLGGPSGVGKTVLVRSVYQEIAKAGRGLLLSGKHDQLGRSVPYAALAQAFGGLMRDLAASPKPIFDAWKERLDKALGPLSRVIADIVPELEWLMGELPPVPVVPTEMTYNRLKLSWIEFVRAVADASPPLVLFLDDMQWADPASLELLKVLLTDVAKKNLLVIAAYRNNEVDAAHPLWGMVEAIQKAEVKTPRVTVGPLDEASVREWLASALSADGASVTPLARALHTKTLGNPFFLGQLLLELHRKRRVRRNLDSGAWEWDQNAVEQAAITDNVVELMRQKVFELSSDAQTLLGQAACAGHGFSLAELGILSGLEPQKVAEGLRPALLASLVIPQDGQYREAQAMASEGSDLDASYRFLHDRVQQAFYERIDPDKRAQTHLMIGRRLQSVFDKEGGSNQKLLELTRHLNLGAAALSTDDEHNALAVLNLKAAKAAKANGSYRLQANLVEQAQALLEERAWQDEPELSVELALERIEADFMLREFDDVHRRAQDLLDLPLPNLPRLAAQELRIRACLATGQYVEGERLGTAALAEQGITFPESNDACMMQTFLTLLECEQWLDENPDGFALMTSEPSPVVLLCEAIGASLMMCAGFSSRPALGALVCVGNVERAIARKTLTIASPYSITMICAARSIIMGRYRSDVRWIDAGIEAARRLASPYLSECMYLRAFYMPHEFPVTRCRPHFHEQLREAIAAGSFQGTSWGLMGELFCLDFWFGGPLGSLASEVRARRGRVVRYGDALGQHALDFLEAFADFLSAPRAVVADGAQWLVVNSSSLLALGDSYIAQLARIAEAHVFLAFGNHPRGLERADEAEKYRAECYGAIPVTDIPLWRGLAAAKCWSPALPELERQSFVERLDHGIARVRYFSEGCADNFLHKLRLLEAERARIHGRITEAMAKYDEAIDLARKEGFLHIEGLAAHFCADFYLELGRKVNATTYLQTAREGYKRWEALALVAHLDDKYADLLKPQTQAAQSPPVSMTISTTETTGAVALDVHTAIRAAQALSGELDPDRVVGRLMELCLANAGAERGALVFAENDALVLVARLSVQDSRIETGLSIPLAQCDDVATTVVRYVVRSRESLVVNDVVSEKRFTDDAYLATNTVRSLLALPLTHRGRLGGVLYLEHQTAPSAFPPSRVELLSVIASQAAIAVENARLYQNIEAQLRALEARNREVQQLNDELRRQIAQRSRRLMETLISSDQEMQVGSYGEGSVIGDCYRVIKMLGEGGMGAVYEVERTTDGVHLAAKVLNHSPDRNDLGRFAREAQILAKLSHPNLISIYDIDVTDDGVLYIVMELVAGSTLREIEGRTGDVPWIRSVLEQIAKALDALHSISIVHRDLKPENVLVVSAGSNNAPVVKLADFGISIVTNDPRLNPKADAHAATLYMNAPMTAIPADRASMLTQTGVLVGTPLYMAPELGYGSKNALPSSDVFAFGVIAYELLTGEKPYSFPPALGGMISDDVPLKLQLCAALPAQWAEVIARCLAMDPEKRPSAKEIAEL